MDELSLRTLYSAKTRELEQALLSGALWHEIEEQRKAVTEIGIALHRKLLEKGKVSPADFAIRHTIHTDERVNENNK